MTLLTATLDDDGPRARLILRFGRIEEKIAGDGQAHQGRRGLFAFP